MEWISVKDRLPNPSETVGYTWNGSMIGHEDRYNHAKEMFEEAILDYERFKYVECSDITHWMPLPEPPRDYE